MPKRCAWVEGGNITQLDIDYHDHEWGVPVHDDQRLFEFLVLEGAQAGLSWSTILSKRENYRKAFCQFDIERVAQFTARKQQQLLNDAGIVRNRLKIASAISNAQAVLEIQRDTSFASFLWEFVEGETRQNTWQNHQQVPATSKESEAMSRELKRRGFKFVGPTICYAFMQATGMVNDHTTDCFRHRYLQRKRNVTL